MVGETHATRERVVVQLKKNISSEAERHRQPHLLRIQKYLLSLFPTAHVTSGTSTAEHDTITMRGVVQWTGDQMRQLAAHADAVEVDCLSGAATMYINKISGYVHAAPSKSTLCLDVALCIFMLVILWIGLHCIFPEWLWSVPSSVESLLSLGDLTLN